MPDLHISIAKHERKTYDPYFFLPIHDTGNKTQYFHERSERLELDFAYVLLNLIARCLWIYGKATSGLMSLDLAGFNPFTLT